MQDSAIIALYWERSEAAITATEEAYGNYCRSISSNILSSREDVEECVSDTWLAAWNNIPPQRPARLSAFLGRITRNLSLDRWRQNNTEKRGSGRVSLVMDELDACIPADSDVEHTVEMRELVQSIERFLRSQPPLKQRIFIRRYWHMESIAEISAAFSISENKAASLLFRMRNALRSYLEKEGIIE